ncbi:MAG: MAPEG family protein [Candidatus Binatia bacterium]
MTTDLWYLVWTALLTTVIPMIYLAGRLQVPSGLQWALGNRDDPLEIPVWAERAQRAHANLTENLATFAVLVLVAHVAGKANATTALGAQIFFWARVGHVAIYTAGIPGLRTGVFFVGAAGELMILFQLFK